MNEWNSNLTMALVIISNLVAVILALVAIKWPRIARICFFLLFSWAAYTNWQVSHQHPTYYLSYAVPAWNKWYAVFIRGWFSHHITTVVSLIAVCQLLIAVSMLLKGKIFVIGVVGAMVFFISILPLGAGSAFPCTAILAYAIYLTTEHGINRYIWQKPWSKQVSKKIPLSFTQNPLSVRP